MIFRVLVIATLSVVASPAPTADFPSLLKSVPDGANALLLIDADALKKTPLAQKQGWFEAAPSSSDRPWYLPPEAQKIVVATALDPTAEMKPEWEAAVIGLGSPLDLKSIAQSEGGYVDDVGGKQVVWAPSGAYLIPLGANVLGEMAPANRQAAARWVASTKSGSLTPYLASAAGVVTDRFPIVMAFDLADAIPPHAVYQAVRTTDAINAAPARRDSIAKVLASLRGVTIMVGVNDDAAATVRFDFAENVTHLADLESKLFEILIDRLGASVRATEGWDVKASGTTVRAHGHLGVSGLRRLFSLIEVPTTKFSSLAGAKPASEKDVIAKASKEYFGSVASMLDDLREDLSKAETSHALYMERYARNVDRLPILNVDDELLDWGASISETLRGGGQSVRSAGLRSGVRKSSAYGAYQYSYDGYGYYGGQPTENALGQVAREEGAAARSDVYGSWKEMEDSTAAIRRTMTKKYGLEF